MPREVKVADPVATIPLPSADLIVYRFDQLDRSIEDVKKTVSELSNSFVTKEESLVKRQEYDRRLDEIDKRFAAHTWYWRALFSAAALALFTSIAAILLKQR